MTYFCSMQPVGALHQRAELGAESRSGPAPPLRGGAPRPGCPADSRIRHISAAHVLEAVDRRHREVAALDGRAVAHVAAFEAWRRCSRALPSESIFDEAARHVDVPAHLVEDEELGLGAEVGGVADAAALQVGLGALGERARVALVGLAVARLEHVAASGTASALRRTGRCWRCSGRASAACRRLRCPSSRRSTNRRRRGRR